MEHAPIYSHASIHQFFDSHDLWLSAMPEYQQSKSLFN
jgi:hypothetical protein